MTKLKRRTTDRQFSGRLSDRIRHARRIAQMSQTTLAKRVGVVPSAVAQWEGQQGTSPTMEHMMLIAQCTGVAFEWLATGRGLKDTQIETPAVALETFALDMFEERLLLAYRRLPPKKRERFVDWLEGFV